MSTGEAMLEQSTTIKSCASIAEYYRNIREVAPVEYNRKVEYYRRSGKVVQI